ncbi:asparaginase domain-containing protein [Corynebacterium uterequi]|uniref:L-asparaginase/GlutRNAGln amidotransferase subunit D n=1 Tax=Corynebacterium uterequi TaxID=1072256 RepID=A0A0G3HFC2_9CORY|nr:asparaginase domain-containing protein [Corynebacterium uterequi]AKK11445.1 L-asparaginase/GlutRNAGln amidotransferase subunit D [Corynebacterium uterequi]
MISLLTTGGTIACTQVDGALVPTLGGAELLASAHRVAADLPPTRVTDLSLIDSSAMDFALLDTVLDAVAAALDDSSAVVLTHGTDSLEETALAMDLLGGPIVLTGAQRPADHPHPDGPGNLAAALTAAASVERAAIAFGGRVIPARGAYKTDTHALAAFASNDAPTRAPAPRARLGTVRIPIVAAYPGAPEWIIDDAVRRGADGLVVEALGSGNMSPACGDAVARAAASIPVVIATRVARGGVALAYGGAGGGATLSGHGVLSAGRLSAGQARIALAWAVAAGVDPASLL